MTDRNVGDRVVVAWHRREYAATILFVHKSTRVTRYMVETDKAYNREGHTTMHRWWHEVYDAFSDGSRVPPIKTRNSTPEGYEP